MIPLTNPLHIRIRQVENGFIVEGCPRGDAAAPAHVFTDPETLGEWVKEQARIKLEECGDKSVPCSRGPAVFQGEARFIPGAGHIHF